VTIAFKPLLLTAALIGVLAVAGCAAQESANQAVSTIDASVDQDGTEAPAVVAGDVTVLEAVEASYQLWLANGMTEEVTSSGERYVLTYQPSAGGGSFLAALYNLDLDDIIPIEQPELFTVYSAWAMLKDDATVIVEGENKLSLENKDYGDFTVFIENGLIVSGEEATGAWTGVFSYEPDLALLERLEREINE
jgi:hypothetical protein